MSLPNFINKCIAVSLVIIVFISCDKNSLGRLSYASVKPTKLGLYINKLQGYAGYTMGMHLELYPDSAFTLSTCGHIANGTWIGYEDKVVLKTKKIVQKIDSIKTIAAIPDTILMYKDDIIFKRKGDKLINVSFGRLSKLEIVD